MYARGMIVCFFSCYFVLSYWNKYQNNCIGLCDNPRIESGREGGLLENSGGYEWNRRYDKKHNSSKESHELIVFIALFEAFHLDERRHMNDWLTVLFLFIVHWLPGAIFACVLVI